MSDAEHATGEKDAAPPLGVYVHFPWCRLRCPYCDFAIAVTPEARIPHDAYADAVLAELDVHASGYAGRTLRSVYFGGGTPGLWRADALGRVLAGVRARFPGEPREVTVETNPGDCAEPTLRALRAAGVNRLSIGAQSFDDGELVLLGRDHGAAASLSALGRARTAGFDNVSLDLICALPGRTPGDLARTLERALALAPEHVSVYQLTIEERTTFWAAVRRGSLRPLGDDQAASQLALVHETLTRGGYEHYEVSSYARPGRRAVHNSLYWVLADTLGVGSGAHSFRRLPGGGGVRWGNHRSVKTYLAAPPDGKTAEETVLSAAELAADRVWLGLRTRDGVARSEVAGRTALARLVAAGLLTEDGGDGQDPDGGSRVRPTPRGLLLADEMAATLLTS